jgi:hypothetical protein
MSSLNREDDADNSDSNHRAIDDSSPNIRRAIVESSSSIPRTIDEPSPPEGKGMEGKGYTLPSDDGDYSQASPDDPKKPPKFSPTEHLKTAGVAYAVIRDWLDLRKAKKSPVTLTAIEGIEREAKKAGWSLEDALRASCERGWTGFKAEWVKDDKPVTIAAKPVLSDLEAQAIRDAQLAEARERYRAQTAIESVPPVGAAT